jgi:hypothetical protein
VLVRACRFDSYRGHSLNVVMEVEQEIIGCARELRDAQMKFVYLSQEDESNSEQFMQRWRNALDDLQRAKKALFQAIDKYDGTDLTKDLNTFLEVQNGQSSIS